MSNSRKPESELTAKPWTRRDLFRAAGVAALTPWLSSALAAGVKLPSISAPSEKEQGDPPAPLPASERIGYAVVGLGHLALEYILPAFASSRGSKLTALVSGDARKAATVAAQYGVPAHNVYDYRSYDRLKDNPDVQAIYIVLPNSMHAEFTVRGAQAGKHILCEKPMAVSVKECQLMIDACRRADRKLMIAYRLQYEPRHRALIDMARSQKLGKLQLMTADNGQNVGGSQWRLQRALAGGGALPDVGIYCLNAARYLSGEEPIEVSASMSGTGDDDRFKEVEKHFLFTARFPSGFTAHCTSSYGVYESRRLRLMGSEGFADLDPAFSYRGLQLRTVHKDRSDPKSEDRVQHLSSEPNQFGREMDHFSECIRSNRTPHTPGEEGMQDMHIIEALYRAAREQRPVRLEAASKLDAFRGPVPVQEG